VLFKPDASSAVPTHDEFVMKLSGLRLVRLSPLPDGATQSLVHLHRNAPETIEGISFKLEQVSVPAPQPGRDSRQRFLRRLGGLIDIPLVSNLLYSLVEALPLLIFWRLVLRRKKEMPPFAASLATTVGSLLLFHFTLYFLGGSARLFSDSSFIRNLWKSVGAMLGFFPLPAQGAYRTVPVILGILLPELLLQRSGWSSPQSKRPIVRWIQAITALLLFAGMIVLGVYLLYRMGWTPSWVLEFFVYSLLALLIWGAMSALYRLLALQAPRPGVTLVAMLLIVVIGVVEALEGYMTRAFDLPPWMQFVWLVMSVVLGMPLLLSLVSVIRAQIRQAMSEPTVPRWARRLLMLLAVSLVIPMHTLVSTSGQLAYDTDVLALAYRLDDLILFVWLAGVIWLLYRHRRSGQQIDAFARTVGILGASSLLFSATAHWLYIPVEFLIGLFLLSQLVRPVEYWKELKPFFKRVVRERLDLLDQILDLNAAENAYKELRKKLRGKLSSGEVSVSEYDEQLEKSRKQLDVLRHNAAIEGQPAKAVVLAFGLHSSAWENGVHGTKFALLFATPWIVLFLRNFLSGPMSPQAYPLWDFAVDLLHVVAKWAVFGFVFGYFYPYLRGNNGLQKGLGLFLVSVLPALPLMGVSNATTEAWQASLFWVLQVFIQCMLLGLVAFDYAILRQGRYDWQMLFEVHGLTSVGISVSSILVAIGATVTTLMTTQTTNLVALALRFVIPQVLPELPIPTPMPIPTPTPMP